MTAFHWDPATYIEAIHTQVPRYDELQAAAIDAIPFPPATVLELGFGTAETTERIWQRYPEARITGLDSSSDMVFKARELGWEEMRLGRIEDPLPDGPWDLVIAVLTINELGKDGKLDLSRRIREHARSVVIGDVIEAPAEEAELYEGEVVWEADDLAVIRAVYD